MNEKTLSNSANAAQTINLLEIWEIFWSRKILIIICVFLALVLAFVKVTYFTKDVYSTSGILYVSNRNDVGRSSDDTVYGTDINTSRLMSTTYMEVLTTRSFLTDVSASVGGGYSWDRIRKMMSISSVNGTELLRVSVSCNSAEDAYNIANGIITNAPAKLGTIFDGGEVKIVELAVVPSAPNGKGLTRMLMLAFLMGLAIGCAIAFVLDYLDTKIHRSDDVAKRYGISILGEISQ
ncbi:MAG: hypothetical protein J1F63_03715 [Oscillospiraceae bacterium]|nr:hypothetical protein [Oscillospiraceae bacterium]